MPDYTLLPPHIREGVKHYIERGARPGHFRTAVICNNLAEAMGRADDTNRARLFDIVSFFYNEAPGPCWGSPEKMKAWMKAMKEKPAPAP